ncbi:MAG: protein-L-isoaspartate(D-aspartate) O-methyltransferase [Planctomycetia bacterium]|nr:protein-L-isoaspartate(D-aspartate) O-methyltransferase [Planctomycetia bacterium]
MRPAGLGLALVMNCAAWCVGLGPAAAGTQDDVYAAARERMVNDDIAAGGVSDPRVLHSLLTTPRHEFLPPAQWPRAYFDMALPIGESQTISGPFVVASMTEKLEPKPGDRVLEIGTGSGYQAAVLAPLVTTVYSIEIMKPLADRAARTLKRLGYSNIVSKAGDGYQGWPEHAPFDGIIVTCSPEDVPQPLLDQLAEGGRMVIPVGERFDQKLVRITKRQGALVRETLEPTLFVPMTGAAEESRRVQPDGSRPAIRNGGFEEMVDHAALPEAWYYGRQCELVSDGAGEGARCLRLANAEPGRPAQIFQGFAVDGTQVSRLRIRLLVRGRNLVAGRSDDEQPFVVVKFLDEGRKRSSIVRMGPWSGTFSWKHVEDVAAVPAWAREASLMVGMGGATGAFDADQVAVSVEPR